VTRYLEILGQSVPVPDPDSVAILSSQYRAVATTIGVTKSQLAGIGTAQAQAVWAGQAASAFSRKLGELPGQLEQAWQSYNTVAWALSGYASALRPVVAALSSLAYQAEEAEGTLRATVSARNQVISQGHDPVATGWNTRLWEAQAEVGQVGRRLSALLAELEGLSAQCVRAIQQAEHEGISNNLISDFDRYIVQDVAEPWADAQAWELRMLLTGLDDILLHPITGLYEDIAHFNWHTPLESLGKCFDQLGFLLGLACLLVPGLGEAAAISFLAAAALDAAARARHERGASWGQAGFAMANGLLMGAGSVAGLGARADQGYLQNAFDQGDLAQMSAIKYGTDARVSGSALRGVGVQRFFSLNGIKPDLAGDGVMTTLKDDAYSFTHLGAERYTYSPAAVTLQHVEYGFDRASDAVGMVQDELEKGHGS
jgi:uncharacterized protein YukE